MNSHYLFSFSYIESKGNGPKNVSATIIFCDRPTIDQSAVASDITEFFETHYQTDEIYVLGANFLEREMHRVFKDSVQQSETFIGIPRREDTHLDQNLHLITFDRAGVLTCSSKTLPEGFERKMINEGLQRTFLQHGGLIESEGTHHFVFPSGKHCDKFLRAGNVLLHGCEINFVAFALLGHFDESQHDRIYCDTSSINSVAFALVQMKNNFRGEKESLVRVPISSFSSYDGLYKANKKNYGKTALLLISASTSSNIVTYIIKNHPIVDRDNIVVLYFLGESWSYFNVQDKVLCNLTLSVENPKGIEFYKTYKEHDCQLCKRGSYPLKVSGDVFLLENPKINKILLKRSDCQKPLEPFVNQFRTKKDHESVLKTNFKEKKGQNEKYEVYIDFTKIVAGIRSGRYLTYKKKLDAYLNRFVPSNTKYIITLNDSGSQDLSNYVLEQIAANYVKGKIPEIVKQDDLADTLTDEEMEGTVVVIGSCISNGKNLLYISRTLRPFDKLQIVYMVGLARTRNETYLDDLRKNLTMGGYGQDSYTFAAINTLYCNSYSRNTPWIQEIDFLKKFRDFLLDEHPTAKTTITYIDERLKMLRQSGGLTERGLTEKLFYPKPGSKREELTLRKNFAFWKFDTYVGTATQADCFFTISNIVNSLRQCSDKDRNLRQTPYVRNLFDPANFSRFNDGVIQASILRTARPEELAYTNSGTLGQEMYGLLETLIKYHKGDQGEGLLEFLYAIADQKLTLKKMHLELLVELLKDTCKDELINCFTWYIEKKVLHYDEDHRKTQVEVFNKLMALDISSIKHHKDGISVVKGITKKGGRVLIIWRDEHTHSNEALNNFIQAEGLHSHEHDFNTIYVNGHNEIIKLKTEKSHWDVQLIEDVVFHEMFRSNNGGGHKP